MNFNWKRDSNRRNKHGDRHPCKRNNDDITTSKTREIEEALAAQRANHSNVVSCSSDLNDRPHDIPKTSIAPHIPGMVYDPLSDRYYKASNALKRAVAPTPKPISANKSQRLAAGLSGVPVLESREYVVENRFSLVTALTARSLGLTTDNTSDSSRNYGGRLLSGLGMSGRTWKDSLRRCTVNHLYMRLCPGVTSRLPSVQFAFHSANGAVLLEGRIVKLFRPSFAPPQPVGAIRMLETRIANTLSNPVWRPLRSGLPGQNSSVNLACIEEGNNMSQSQVVYLQLQPNNNNDNDNDIDTRHERGSLEVSAVSGRTMGKNAIRNIAWSANGDMLYSMCEHAVYADLVLEESSSNHNDPPRGGRMIIDGRQPGKAGSSCSNGKSVGSPAVAIATSVSDDNLIFIGLRNGGIISTDLRAPTATVRAGSGEYHSAGKVGSLPFCVDHMLALKDGFSLVAQDVTGTLCVYDIRKASTAAGGGRGRGPYMTIVGQSNGVRKRGFWVTDDESTVVAPANCDLTAKAMIGNSYAADSHNSNHDRYAYKDERTDTDFTLQRQQQQSTTMGAHVAVWDLRYGTSYSEDILHDRLLALKTVQPFVSSSSTGNRTPSGASSHSSNTNTSYSNNDSNDCDVGIRQQIAAYERSAVAAAGGSAALGFEAIRKRSAATAAAAYQAIPWDIFRAQIAPNVENMSSCDSSTNYNNYNNPFYGLAGVCTMKSLGSNSSSNSSLFTSTLA